MTNTADSGVGSLRQAILSADAISGSSTIDFSIPGSGVHDINPTTELPAITQPVTIDGTSQPGYAGSPLIEIFGGMIYESSYENINYYNPLYLSYGLDLAGDGATVEGLTFNYFNDPAITISGSDNSVQGDVFGTSVGEPVGASTNNIQYLPSGVEQAVVIQTSVAGGAGGNTIGGTTADAGNQILADSQGILIQSGGGGAMDNLIEGNTIAALPAIDIEDANGNTIGGTVAGAGNILSRSGYPANQSEQDVGILNENSSNGTLIAANTTGDTATSEFTYGIDVVDSSNVTIGGTTAAARNVVTGASAAIQIAEDARQTGVAEHDLIEGNFVGTNASGTAAAPYEGGFGIILGGSSFDTIGGTAAGAGNLVSGNSNASGNSANPTAGIALYSNYNYSGGVYETSNNNLVEGNLVGTDLTGTQKIGNVIGILDSGTNNTIGGTTPGAGNVISGNSGAGIALGELAIVEGNLIGTDITGTKPLGNGGDGIDYGSDSTIGGTVAGAGNVISANGGAGISAPMDSATFDALIQGNLIGTDITGTKPLGNIGAGISLNGIQNTVGGTTPSAANVIAANGADGIDLDGTEALDGTSDAANLVEGNFIGTDRSATLNLGNGGIGVSTSSSSNTVGGVVAGSGNTVEFNAQGSFDDTGLNNVLFGNFPEADLVLSSTLTPSAITTGSNVIFTFTVTNQSAITADDTKVFFTLPTPGTFALTAVELPGGAAANLPDSNPLTSFFEPVGNLAPGASYTIAVIGVAYATSGAVEVDGTAVSAQLDPNVANNTAQPAVPITGVVADLGVVSSAPKGPAKVGQQVAYTFKVVNFGPDTAANVQLTLIGQAPADVQIVKITTKQGTVTKQGSVNDLVNIGTLRPGQSVLVTVTVKILRSPGSAAVYAFGGSTGTDPNPSNNAAVANIPVQTTTTKKVAAKSIHEASVPTPTSHFLGTRKTGEKRPVAEKARG